jgi:hypothetical protein
MGVARSGDVKEIIETGRDLEAAISGAFGAQSDQDQAYRSTPPARTV